MRKKARNKNGASFWIGLIAIALSAWGCNGTGKTLTAISLSPSSPAVVVGQTWQISATATYSDQSQGDISTQVSWSSSDTSVATISSGGLLTALNAGSTTLKALDPSSGIAATESVSVTNGSITSVKVSPSIAQIPLGATQALTATGLYSDQVSADLTKSATWSSSDNGILAIDAAGNAQALSPGIVTVSATDPQSGLSAEATISVTPAVLKSIAVTLKNAQVPAGASDQAAATGTYSDGTSRDITSSVTWTSSNTGEATISAVTGSRGLISALQAGSVAIQAGDPTTGITASANLVISTAVLSSIEVSPAFAQLPAGVGEQVFAKGVYSDGTILDISSNVTWSSSAAQLVSVSATGSVTGLQSDVTATITATDPTTGIAGEATFAVSAAKLVSLAVSLSASQVAAGNASQAAATGTYSDGSTADVTSTVQWSSSSASTASVSTSVGTKGALTTYHAGSAAIQATDPATGITASSTLTITNAALVSVSVSPGASQLIAGTSETLTATGTYSDGTTQTLTGAQWSVSNPSVASGNGQGQFTGSSEGIATVTATDLATGISGSASVAVANATLLSIDLSYSNGSGTVDLGNGQNCLSMALGSSLQLKATGTYSNGWTRDISDAVNWDVEDSYGYVDANNIFHGVASISAVGDLTVGTCPSGQTCAGSNPDNTLVWANAPGLLANFNNSCLNPGLGT